MITAREIIASTRASVRLLLGDGAGMAALDCTIAGFWRSFGVMVLLAPTALLAMLLDRDIVLARLVEAETFDVTTRLISGLVSYGLGWVAFPVALAVLARPLGLSARYVPYMVARNWTTIIGTAPYVAVTVGALVGLFPLAAVGPASLAALCFNLWYSWRVTSLATGVPTGFAIGLVALDFLLTLLVEVGVDRLAGL